MEKQQIDEHNAKLNLVCIIRVMKFQMTKKKNTCNVDKISIIPDCLSYHHYRQQHHYCHPNLRL